ncbi:10880_t:CDS:2 [Entrophospora sp. SA101]|nr:10880_t:CDS:2 [Entrophospora sp. SA101]
MEPIQDILKNPTKRLFKKLDDNSHHEEIEIEGNDSFDEKQSVKIRVAVYESDEDERKEKKKVSCESSSLISSSTNNEVENYWDTGG